MNRRKMRFTFSSIIIGFMLFVPSQQIEENCTDFQGKTIEHGNLYVPGPSVCSMCVCYHSEPKWCSDIYCDPPYFCNKFRVKERCCEVECLEPPGDIAATMLREHRSKYARSTASNYIIYTYCYYFIFGVSVSMFVVL